MNNTEPSTVKYERKWARVSMIIHLYGLKKTYLYEKLNSGEIESKLISKKVRLVSISSVEAFIESK